MALEKYRILVENAMDAFFVHETNGAFVEVNQQACDSLGYTRDELLRLGIPDISLDFDPEGVQAVLGQVLAGNVMTVEDRHRRKDGSWFPVEVRVGVVQDRGQTLLLSLVRDISARREAERGRQRAETRLRAIFDAAGDSIILVDPDNGKLVEFNTAAHRDMGYTREEFAALTLSDLEAAETHENAHLQIRKALAAGGDVFETRWQTKAGEIRDMRVDTRPVELDGKTYFSGIVRDITERKRTRRQLEAMQFTLENSVDEIFWVDRSGTINYANRTACRNLGYTPDEICGMDLGRVVPDLGMSFNEMWRAAQEQRTVAITPKGHMRKDGSIYPVHAWVTFMDYQGEQWLCGFVRDTTEHVAAQKALAAGERRMELALEGGELGFWDWNIPAGTTYFSPRYFTMLGYEPGELPSTVDTWRDLLHPDERDEMAGALQRELEQGLPEWDMVFRLRAKPGVYRSIHSKGRVYELAEDGSPLRAAGTHQDVTERLALEEKLRHAQKMEAIGTLAGGVAHDFNNVLAAILGYTELSMARADPEDPNRQNLQNVLTAVERARQIVQQILAFSRKTREERSPVHLKGVVKEAATLLRATIPTTIALKLDIPDTLGVVLGDTGQLQQVVMNLVTNAYQALRETGGTIRICLRDAVPGEPDGGEAPAVLLRVDDDGPGIPPELLDRVFEPYFTTKEVGEGSGLGLAVAHGIIATHGGSIQVESIPGKGTTFRVRLPTHTGPEQKRAPESLGKVAAGGTEAILLVDDEPALVELGRETLESLGYRVTALGDPGDALARLRAHPEGFDLVISDQTMPGMTGADLAAEVHQLRPDLPIVLCTGYSDTLDEDEVAKVGVREVAQKPITRSDLSLLVRRALAR